MKVVSQVGPNLTRLLDALAEQSLVQAQALGEGKPTTWMHPPSWAGNPLLDVEAPLSEAFRRREEDEYFKKATEDDSESGTATDVVLSQQQTDYIAVLERAFRRRHASFCREALAVSSREAAMGSAAGPLLRGVKTAMQQMLASAAEATRRPASSAPTA